MNAFTSISAALGAARRNRRIGEADFFLPLAIIGGLTVLVFTLGTHFAVRAFDRSSAIREQILTQNGIAQRIGEVGQMVVPQVTWDDATAHLDNRFDRAWAEANIGKYLNQTNGIDASYIVDADDRPVFAAEAGVPVADSHYRSVAALAEPLLRQVRAREAARGPIAPATSNAMVAHAIQASTLERIDGTVSVLTATLVQPDFGKALPTGPRSPIVVTTMQIDQPFLDSFAQRYLLTGLRVRALGQPALPGEIEIPASDDDGRTIAWFAWKPLDPGYAMLREFLPPIGLIALVLAFVAAIQLRKVHIAARTLLSRDARRYAAWAEV